MFNVRWNSSPERQAELERVLPKQPLTDTILLPALKELMQDALKATLRAEIEVYKAFPKTNGKLDRKTFNPRNHKTCFMGQGFIVGSGGAMADADLKDYRRAVGTLAHAEWGDATLLECWAADHFEKYPDMVSGVFDYCIGKRKTVPKLYFHIIPLYKNKESGVTVGDEEDKAVALEQYKINLNGLRVEMGLATVEKVEGDFLKDFELQWQNRHTKK